MEALRETTVWDGVDRQPNHIYLFDGSKAVAYIKWGEGEPYYFKSPMNIDRRGRKFVAADKKLFNTEPATSLIEVKGSKGNSYWVDAEAKTCTCPGFQFRGACKHVEVL
jgi:hypothetical protein